MYNFAAYAGVKGVELLRQGRKIPAKTGHVDVDHRMMHSILEAAADKSLRDPVIKIGHDSKLGDGHPAYGWVRNLRLEDTKLRGDYVSMPMKLAELTAGNPDEPAPFRSRSVEIRTNVTAPSGKTYPYVLSAVALLGETLPAIQSLEDIYELYHEPAEVAASYGDVIETIVDTDDGTLVDAFGAGIQQTEVEVGNMTSMTREAEGSMELDRLRDSLGLDDDAPDEQVLALAAETIEHEKTTVERDDPDPDTTTTTVRETEIERTDNETNPGPSHPPEGVVQLSAGAYETLQRDAALGRKAYDVQLEAHREKVLNDAIAAGKITTGEREHFATMLLAAPTETEVLIDHLVPRIHLSEIGHSGDLEQGVESETYEKLFGDDPLEQKGASVNG